MGKNCVTTAESEQMRRCSAKEISNVENSWNFGSVIHSNVSITILSLQTLQDRSLPICTFHVKSQIDQEILETFSIPYVPVVHWHNRGHLNFIRLHLFE